MCILLYVDGDKMGISVFKSNFDEDVAKIIKEKVAVCFLEEVWQYQVFVYYPFGGGIFSEKV